MEAIERPGGTADAPVPGISPVLPALPTPPDSLEVPLVAGFRYVHEPLDAPAPVPLLGGPALVEALKERLRFSSGGSFLLTGFRGVGKTTVVLRALRELESEPGAGTVFVPVSLSVARPMNTAALLFAVVRRTFETLQDRGIFARLPAETQRALVLSYLRTSLSLSEKRAEASETSTGVSLGGQKLAGGGAPAAILSSLLPKLDVARKRSRSLATEASFLAYSDTDVEHDFLRIVGLLSAAHTPTASAARRVLQRAGLLRTPPSWRGHLVVVLDELDKLTATERGVTALDELLVNLKNVLNVRGAHFLFVGGPDLHDRALAELNRGSGIYESVFGWHEYVTCQWGSTDELLDALAPAAAELPALRGYLEYKSRGLPRRLLQELHEFVVWRGDQALLRFDAEDLRRLEFYGRLQRIVTDHLDAADRRAPVAIDEDRRRLSAYYATDWVLRSAGAVFSSADLFDDRQGLAVDPLIGLTVRSLERLLEHLHEEGFLDAVEDRGGHSTFIGDLSAPPAARYRLSERVLQQTGDFARASDRERADLAAPVPAPAALPAHPTLRPVPPAPVPVASAPPPAAPAASATYPPGPPAAGPPAAGPPAAAPRAVAPPAAAPPPPVPQADAGWAPASSAAAKAAPGAPWREDTTFSARVVGDGRYRLGALLGVGAIGAVYEAEDLRTGRTVAVKLLESHALRSDPMARERFLREARVARLLRHPGVVTVHELLEEPDGRLAIVMDRVVGPTLAEELARRRFSPREAVAVGLALADTLQHLHDHGVARIDLKPSNIILTPPEASPVIVDLGLARSQRDDEGRSTAAGVLVGTPAYMAPEQIRGDRADIRSDLYALGMILFEMAAPPDARPPLDSIPAELQRALSEPLPLERMPGSAALRAVLARLTEKAPAERFATPHALREALLATPEAASGQPAPG